MHARRAFYATVYSKHTDWETWGIGHMKERERQVEHRAGLLKKNHKLSEEHASIIKCQLSSKLQQVACPTLMLAYSFACVLLCFLELESYRRVGATTINREFVVAWGDQGYVFCRPLTPTGALTRRCTCLRIRPASRILNPSAHFSTMNKPYWSLAPQVAKKSPDMLPYLDTWQKKMSEVDLFVEQHKASADSSSESDASSGSSDDEDSTPELRTCGVCKPPSGEG